MRNMQPFWLKIFVVCMIGVGVSFSAHAVEMTNGIPRLLEVAPGIYRGGQPTEEGYAHLKHMGIQTVINFRHEKKWIEWDREEAKKHGIHYISIPWTIYGTPSNHVLEEFMDAIVSSEKPIFIHCRRGVERTGVISALYYMKFHQLDADEAYKKATETYSLKLRWKLFGRRQFKHMSKAIQA